MDRPWTDKIECITNSVTYYTRINTCRCIIVPEVRVFDGHLLVVGGETANEDRSIAPSNSIER